MTMQNTLSYSLQSTMSQNIYLFRHLLTKPDITQDLIFQDGTLKNEWRSTDLTKKKKLAPLHSKILYFLWTINNRYDNSINFKKYSYPSLPPGTSKNYETKWTKVWWPNMNNDITRHAKSYLSCIVTSQPEEPPQTQITQTPNKLWETTHMNSWGFFS